jgi:hypothetical protein
MGQVLPLPSPGSRSQPSEQTTKLDVVVPFEADHVHCELCGLPLGREARRFILISPIRDGEQITVCSTCHRAALGEGYRPAV